MAGEIAGNAWSEVGTTAIDTQQTVLSAGEDHEFAIAVVDTRAAGVTVVDDWDGFGQKGTGRGTTAFAGQATSWSPTMGQ